MKAFSFYHLIAPKVKNKGLLHVMCNIDDILVQHQTRPRHLAVSQLVTWELTPPGTQGWAGRSINLHFLHLHNRWLHQSFVLLTFSHI